MLAVGPIQSTGAVLKGISLDFTPDMLRPLAHNDYDWNPERSPSGPITMVVSAADKAIYVYRNGNPIGRAAVEIGGFGSQ